MQCVYCGAPLPKRGLICQYCGQRNPLNLSVLEKINFSMDRSTVNLDCPDCKIETEVINIGLAEDMYIHRCRKCDGIFLSEKTLEDAIRHQLGVVHKVDYSLLRFILDNPRQTRENDQTFRFCPVCNRRMSKGNYAAISGVIIDKCSEHGIWLDSGELQQILEWKTTYMSLKQKELQEKKIDKISQKSTIKETKNETKSILSRFIEWLEKAEKTTIT